MREQLNIRAQGRTVQEIAEAMIEYWSTYMDQRYADTYTDATVLHDAVYGIGIAMDPDAFQFADGYDDFRGAILTELYVNISQFRYRAIAEREE